MILVACSVLDRAWMQSVRDPGLTRRRLCTGTSARKRLFRTGSSERNRSAAFRDWRNCRRTVIASHPPLRYPVQSRVVKIRSAVPVLADNAVGGSHPTEERLQHRGTATAWATLVRRGTPVCDLVSSEADYTVVDAALIRPGTVSVSLRASIGRRSSCGPSSARRNQASPRPTRSPFHRCQNAELRGCTDSHAASHRKGRKNGGKSYAQPPLC
jgi:hypothetical protein